MMRIGSQGKALLEQVEGRRKEAYLDTAGKWTIGIGHLIRPEEMWMVNQPITDQKIDELFAQDIATAEAAVARLFPSVKRQNQFDALVSFVYNLGEGTVSRGSLPKLIADKAGPEVITEKWKQYVYSGGRVTPGLVTRRMREVRLYWAHLVTGVLVCFGLAALALASAATLYA